MCNIAARSHDAIGNNLSRLCESMRAARTGIVELAIVHCFEIGYTSFMETILNYFNNLFWFFMRNIY